MPTIDTDQGAIDFPDEMGMPEIEAALAKLYSGPNGIPGLPRGLRTNPRTGPGPEMGPRDFAGMADPGSAGLVGSLAFSPLGPAGSTLGAGASAYGMSALRQRLLGQPFNNAENSTEAAKAATLTGVGELAALPMAAIVDPVLKSRIAQRVMGNVLKPGAKLLNRSPELVSNALREGIPLSEGMAMTGTKEMGSRLGASHALEDEIAVAHPTDRMWDPRQVIQQVRDQINMGLPKNETARIEDNPEWQALEQDFLSRFRAKPQAAPVRDYPAPAPPQPSTFNQERPIAGSQRREWKPPTPEDVIAGQEHRIRAIRSVADRVQRSQAPQASEFNPFDVQDLLIAKRGADSKVLKLHAATEARKLGAVGITPEIDDLFHKTLADVMRGNIRAAVPQLGEQMGRTADLGALRAAYGNAEPRPENLVTANPVLAALRMASGPGPASRMALNLYQRSLQSQGFSRFAPEIARLAPRAFMPFMSPMPADTSLNYLNGGGSR